MSIKLDIHPCTSNYLLLYLHMSLFLKLNLKKLTFESLLSCLLCILFQYMTEKMGGAEGTKLDLEFVDMERVSTPQIASYPDCRNK